ncbi:MULTISPECIES: fimbria/pilus outer membrane usher protein [Pseudomonas]|uniref:fimbria/pilus outer membrane usher protein n=1 Tax=Pseudomonas TaxID=286 RepID=UPI0030030D26
MSPQAVFAEETPLSESESTSENDIQTTTEVDENPVDDDQMFDSSLLKGMGQNIDLSRFAKAGAIDAGTYRIDVIVNGQSSLRQTVTVIKDEAEEGEKRFCFTASDVAQWGVDIPSLPNQKKVKQLLQESCIEAKMLIPDATFSMNLAKLNAQLSIPQAYVGMVRPDYIDPEDWDAGITAGYINYSTNAFLNKQTGSDDSSSFSANLRTGINIAGWRFRHDGRYENKNDEASDYDSQKTYVQTDVTGALSQFTVGEYFTPGETLDSFSFTGIQIASDESMLPETERGFAPVVRGTADTNAKVTITQGDNVIYESTVAPGPFAINDLYPNSNSGDLDVEVIEADGRVKRFTVPFSAVIQMLRPGTSRFSTTLGRFRDDNISDEPEFAQGTYRRGITNDLTLYTGATGAQDYYAFLAGAAVGTPLGAISLDVTHTQASNLSVDARPEDDKFSGESYRLSYNRFIDYSQTNISITASRFSNEDYLAFSDFVQLSDNPLNDFNREKSRYQFNLDQPIGDYGSIYMSGVVQNYWDSEQDTTTFQIGLNKSFSWGNVNLTASRDLEDDSEESSDSFLLTISMPFELGSDRAYINTSVSSDGDDKHGFRTSLNGTGGANDQLNYGVYGAADLDSSGNTENYGGDLQYRTSLTQLGTSTSQGEDFSQYTVSATGTLLAHSGGLVASPEQGDTMALIEAEGAEGAAIRGGLGTKVNAGGYAAVTNLTPYRKNTVALDPKGLSRDVELSLTSQETVPRRGAVVKLEYPTVTGSPLLLRVKRDPKIPFGAQVLDAAGEQVSLVGQGGLIFIRGEYPELRVVWGQGIDESCTLVYDRPEDAPDGNYVQVQAQCISEAS